MHSKIFQLGSKPISEENYMQPDYYDASSFADYIGTEVTDDARKDYIESISRQLNEIFDLDGEALVYKGNIDGFIKNWYADIRQKAEDLDETQVNTIQLHVLKSAIDRTHIDTAYRAYIEEWNGWAGPISDLINYVAKKMKVGDRLYIGSIIDYHY